MMTASRVWHSTLNLISNTPTSNHGDLQRTNLNHLSIGYSWSVLHCDWPVGSNQQWIECSDWSVGVRGTKQFVHRATVTRWNMQGGGSCSGAILSKSWETRTSGIVLYGLKSQNKIRRTQTPYTTRTYNGVVSCGAKILSILFLAKHTYTNKPVLFYQQSKRAVYHEASNMRGLEFQCIAHMIDCIRMCYKQNLNIPNFLPMAEYTW